MISWKGFPWRFMHIQEQVEFRSIYVIDIRPVTWGDCELREKTELGMYQPGSNFTWNVWRCVSGKYEKLPLAQLSYRINDRLLSRTYLQYILSTTIGKSLVKDFSIRKERFHCIFLPLSINRIATELGKLAKRMQFRKGYKLSVCEWN